MQGQRIGYIRISTFDQNPARQLEQTKVDRVFTDKASGKDAKRPELEALLAFVREGDTVVIHSMVVSVELVKSVPFHLTPTVNSLLSEARTNLSVMIFEVSLKSVAFS